MPNSDRALIVDFIRSQRFAVVASTWNGLAQAAVVAYSQMKEVELIFGTYTASRKYRNISTDPRVAIVIGWDEAVTVQYEGTAVELSGEEKDICQQIHLQKHHKSEKYAFREDQRYFKVVPEWIRYTDISQEPEFSFEITF